MINLELITRTRDDAYPFNDDQKAWLTELETGNKAQGRGWLQIDGRYCCLGVACALLGARAIPDTGGVTLFEHGGYEVTKELPMPLVYRLRLRGKSGHFASPLRIDGVEYNTLTAMNDHWGAPDDKDIFPGQYFPDVQGGKSKFTFADIAAYMRHDPYNVFLAPHEVQANGVPIS